MKNYDELYIKGAWLAPVGRSREACPFGLEEMREYKALQLCTPAAA